MNNKSWMFTFCGIGVLLLLTWFLGFTGLTALITGILSFVLGLIINSDLEHNREKAERG